MKLSTSLLRPRALALAAGAAAALACGAASAQTTFAGFTNGCFSAVPGCVPVASSSPSTIPLAPGLTFTNSTFNVMSAGGGVSIGNEPGAPGPNFNNLGSFELTGAAFTYSSSFDLLVTFTAPPNTSPNPVLFTSLVSGTVVATNNGGIHVDFDNTAKHFTFGSGATAGSFDFHLNDVDITAGHNIALSGRIDNVSAVPEPETYALFLAGLGAIGFMARRRKS